MEEFMKQLFTVFKFELNNYYKNKMFIGITLALVLIIAGVLSFPRIMETFDKNDSETGAPTANEEKSIIALQDNSGADASMTLEFFASSMPNYEFKLVDQDIESIKSSINNGEYSRAIIIDTQLKYKYIVDNISMTDYTSNTINSIMQEKYKFDEMNRLGISESDAMRILTASPESEIIKIGKDQTESFWFTYIIIFILYMAIMMYGQMVATNVATEKSTRAMEMLITSAKPVNLIFGKVFGSGFAGLTQMIAIFGTSFVLYNLNQSYWGENHIITAMFDINLDVLIFSLIFFILGYFLYSFIYGALGSLATRTEDINVSIMPVTMMFVVAFMIVMFSMSSGNIDSTLMKIVSYIPFTSPMAMLARITMGEVPMIGIIASIAILIASTIGIGYLSAKIYQMGVLLYGKTLKISELMKMKKQGF